jgi:hypothetical protein
MRRTYAVKKILANRILREIQTYNNIFANDTNFDEGSILEHFDFIEREFNGVRFDRNFVYFSLGHSIIGKYNFGRIRLRFHAAAYKPYKGFQCFGIHKKKLFANYTEHVVHPHIYTCSAGYMPYICFGNYDSIVASYFAQGMLFEMFDTARTVLAHTKVGDGMWRHGHFNKCVCDAWIDRGETVCQSCKDLS